jgi:hypothetical protein
VSTSELVQGTRSWVDSAVSRQQESCTRSCCNEYATQSEETSKYSSVNSRPNEGEGYEKAISEPTHRLSRQMAVGARESRQQTSTA